MFDAHTFLDTCEEMRDDFKAGGAARLIDVWVQSLDLFDAGPPDARHWALSGARFRYERRFLKSP